MRGPKVLAAFLTLVLTLALGSGVVASQQEDEITLNFWKMPSQAPEAEQTFFGGLADQYSAEHPNVNVEFLVLPWDSAFEKYTAAFAGGEAPCVAYQILPWLANFQGQGALAAFEDIGDASVLEGVFPAMLEVASGPDGKHYGAPVVTGHFVLGLNEAVWERAGEPELPTTYEELIPFAQQLTFDTNGRHPGEEGFDPNNIEVYGWSQPGIWEQQINFTWNYLWAFGADVLSEDGTDIGFDNPEGRAALEWLKAMYDSGAASPINLYADADAWNEAFLEGRFGMAWLGQLYPELLDEYPDARFRVMETPAGPAGRFLLGGAGYLTIPANCEHQAEALEFINFVLSDENVQEYATQVLLYPTKPMENTYDDLSGRLGDYMVEAAEQAEYVRLPRAVPYNPDEVILAEINNYLIGQKSLDDMLADLHRQVGLMAENAGM